MKELSCTGIVETFVISGSSEGKQGWFKLEQVVVTLDTGNHTEAQYGVSIDFVNESQDMKTSIELSPQSAKRLADIIQIALSRGAKIGILE